MQVDKLFTEAIQGMQDLTNLIEKAISGEEILTEIIPKFNRKFNPKTKLLLLTTPFL